MKQILRQLIIDFHSQPIPEIHRRESELTPFSPKLRKAWVVIGMRRSGKTYFLYQRMLDLIASGVSPQKILYLNFEDDRLMSFSHVDFQSILDAYFELYPQFANADDVHFFFDEIHEIEGWDKFIRRILDKESFQVYLSGSSSKMLSKEIATSLRGRTLPAEVFPFSFREYLLSRGIKAGSAIATKEKNTIVNLFHNFIIYGGFPERLDISPSLFHMLLQGYLDTVIYRDIIERHKVGKPHIVRELLAYCIQNCSNLLSVLNIYNRFKAQGKSVGKNALYEYMGYFEDAYCLFTVPIFSYSHSIQSLNPKKLYAVDQGLITACSVKPQFEEAMRFENAVFTALRRKGEKPYYYKTRTGKEVDFLIGAESNNIRLIQASQSLAEPTTRKREISALVEAMAELEVSNATILTLDESDTITQSSKSVHILPLWEWLLTN
jgi:hypothetical protein